MSQDIKNYQNIVNSAYQQPLVEAYEDRVRDLAQQAIQRWHGPVNKEHLKSWIQNNINWPLGSVSPATAALDVLKAIGKQISFTGDSSHKIQLLRNAIAMVNRSLENIPDGLEPIDYCMFNYHKHGFTDGSWDQDGDDWHVWVNVAARVMELGKEYAQDAELARYVSPSAIRAAHGKGYYGKYVSKVTQSFVDDNPELARSLGYS